MGRLEGLGDPVVLRTFETVRLDLLKDIEGKEDGDKYSEQEHLGQTTELMSDKCLIRLSVSIYRPLRDGSHS